MKSNRSKKVQVIKNENASLAESVQQEGSQVFLTESEKSRRRAVIANHTD